MLLRPELGALLLALCVAACGGSEEPAAPEPGVPPPVGDVILVVIDTLRADAVGAYAGEDRGTPVLDGLAHEGVLFERASSASSYTRESVLSLFTGQLPASVGNVGWGAEPAGDSQTLALRMRRTGRAAVMVSASVMIDTPGFRRGFDTVQIVGGSQNVSGQSPGVSRTALALAAADPERPLFLYVHYLDPHGPYDPPVDRGAEPAAGGAPERVRLYEDARAGIEELAASSFGPGDSRFEDFRGRYAAELAHVDAALGLLLDGLREQGRLENALVIVTSDHGEEFLEHGYVEHAWTLYEESIRVPLLVHAPGRLAPERVAGRVSGVDLVPTILALLGEEVPELDGEPLFEWTDGRWRSRPRQGAVHFELGIQTRLLLQGVAVGEWKYLAARRWLSPVERAAAVRSKEIGFRSEGRPWIDPWGPVVREELYDLAEDPAEARPLTDAPERLAALRALVEAARPAESVEPPALAPLSPEQRQRLEALGYL